MSQVKSNELSTNNFKKDQVKKGFDVYNIDYLKVLSQKRTSLKLSQFNNV